MMLKLLFLVIISLFFQACQVEDKTAQSTQASLNFDGAVLTANITPDGWQKLNDNIDILFSYPHDMTVSGYPYIEAKVGIGITNNCIPRSACPDSQSSGTTSLTFDPNGSSVTGNIVLVSTNGSLTVNFGTGANEICSSCSADQMASDLAGIIANSTNFALSGYEAFADEEIVTVFSKRYFQYLNGSGTKNLVFRYTVTSTDLDVDGIEISSVINLNGATITYSPAAAVNQNVPTSFILPENHIFIDGVAPYATSVSAPIAGNYATSQQLKYIVNFSEEVNVTGTPSFNLNLTSGSVPTIYKSGSGSTALIFSRVLVASDLDSNGFSSGTTLNVSTILGNTILDQAGNAASTTIAATTSSNILINVIQPTISSVTLPPAMTYTAGQTLDFVLNMSTAVNVTGTPAIEIALNTGTVLATYLSGSGTTALTFRYTVLTNHIDSDGITLISPLALNGGTIKNLAGTQNAALIYTVPATTTTFIDAATGPYVISTLPPSSGMYLEGQNLDFTMSFSSIVNVSVVPRPRLPIIIGSTTVYADYFSGGGTNTIVFRYTVTTSDEDFDGISLNGPIDFNGGSIKDAALKNAITAYNPPSTVGILVDGSPPIVTSVNWNGNGNYNVGSYLNFSVTFSEVVNVIGAPTLSLTVGATPRSAILTSGSGTNTLNFKYQVLSTDADSNGVDITSIALNGSSIRDGRNHNANLTFAQLTTTGYIVDGVSSTITSVNLPVAPPVNGYKIGDTLDFVVKWSEPTYLSGSPRLALMAGVQPVYATYVATGSSSTSFIFRYTVLAGHSAPSGISTSGLQLNSGLLKDAAGNNANLSYAFPSLTSYIIDGIVPHVSALSVPGNLTYKAGQTLNFTLVWNENITVTGTPVLNLIIGNTPVQATLNVTTSNTLIFTYTVLAGELDTNGITLLSAVALGAGITIQDKAGNNAYLQLNPPDLTGVKVDAILPFVLAILAPPNETYKIGETIDFHVIWSEPVTITPGVRIALTIDTPFATRYLDYYAAGSTPLNSVFRYTVVQGNSDIDGISIASAIDPNTGSIKDAATNSAVLTLNPPVLTGVLVDGIRATIVVANPVTPPANGTYHIGQNLDFTVHWTESVTVDTSSGVPYIRIDTYNGYRNAFYVSGSGTPDLVFSYTLISGDKSPFGYTYVMSPVYTSPTYTNQGTIQDGAFNDVYTTFSPWLINYPGIIIDAVPPIITSSYSSNLTTAANGNFFRPGETIQYHIVFNETVKVTGTPKLELDIGGTTKYANYYSGDNSTTLTFRYTIQANDVLLDLDGISVSSAIDLSAGTIADVATNSFVGSLTFFEKDYVYFSNTIARYHLDGDYSSAACYGTSQCITVLRDISGNGYNLTASSPGPEVLSGFGTNSTKYMKFNNASMLKTPNIGQSAKWVIFVMKAVSNGSLTATTSNHVLLTQRYIASNAAWHYYPDYYSFSVPHYHPATYATNNVVVHKSNSSLKTIAMSPSAKLKINSAAFPANYVSTESAPTLWANNTNYVYALNLSTTVGFNVDSVIGGTSFNGQIAEIIFLGTSAVITETHIDKIMTQLNEIHGVFY